MEFSRAKQGGYRLYYCCSCYYRGDSPEKLNPGPQAELMCKRCMKSIRKRFTRFTQEDNMEIEEVLNGSGKGRWGLEWGKVSV